MKPFLIAGSCLGLLGAVAVCAVGCSDAAKSGNNPTPAPAPTSTTPKPDPDPTPTPKPSVAQSALKRNITPVVTPADAATLIDDDDAFAGDLYKAIAPKFVGKSMFFSPHSISLAMAMASVGAKGATATQMASALHFTLPADRLHPAYDALDLALSSRGANPPPGHTPFALNVVSSLWAAPDMNLVPAFLDTLAVDYGAGVRLTDFNQVETARSTINQWVSDETNAKIPELLTPGTIDAGTRTVIANAVYFKASWASQFKTWATTPAPFHAASGDVSVPTMHQTTGYNYVAGSGWKALEIPYDGESLSLVAVLPDDLAAFETTLTGDSLRAIKPAPLPANTLVDLSIPQFKITGASFSLKAALQSLGIVDAFEPSADFSGMTNESVKITDVLHDAFISIDENGTEAAASTAVVFGDAGAIQGPPPAIIDFNLDKPFVFFIRDNATGAIIFLGRVATP